VKTSFDESYFAMVCVKDIWVKILGHITGASDLGVQIGELEVHDTWTNSLVHKDHCRPIKKVIPKIKGIKNVKKTVWDELIKHLDPYVNVSK